MSTTQPPVRIDWQSGVVINGHHRLELAETNLPRGFVVDLDTMQPISGENGACFFVDEATGEWKRYAKKNGKWLTGADGKLATEEGKGRVKFFPFDGTLAQFQAYLVNWIAQNP